MSLRLRRGSTAPGGRAGDKPAKNRDGDGLNRPTVSKYLKDPASVAPPKRKAADQRPRRVVDEVASLIDAMLRSEILLKARVIHERLALEYAVTINYQRVKLYLQEARPRIAEELGISPGELAGLHRRFEVIPGVQAQVGWGDEARSSLMSACDRRRTTSRTLLLERVRSLVAQAVRR